MQLQLTSMGISRARVAAAIRSALMGHQRGWYLGRVAQMQDEQLAAMDLTDGDDDDTIVGYLRGETCYEYTQCGPSYAGALRLAVGLGTA